MIDRRRFLAIAGTAALAPIARPALPMPAPATPLLASNALALLRG